MSKRLPDMSKWTLDEIADFFDTHDLSDYEDDLEVVRVPSSSMKVVPIRLDEEDVDAIKAIAKKKKVSYTALIRRWAKEGLKKETVP
jgi:predicted DNA binding CopG/RHH family protein